MTDEPLRALEHQVARGEPVDRMHLIEARLRAGAITTDRVVFAAWLGDPSARVLLGPEGPELPTHADSRPPVEDWDRLLGDHGRRVLEDAIARSLHQRVPEGAEHVRALWDEWIAGAQVDAELVAQLGGLCEAFVASQAFEQAFWARAVRDLVRARSANLRLETLASRHFTSWLMLEPAKASLIDWALGDAAAGLGAPR